MPDYEVEAKTFQINREAVITDSNLLIDAFWKEAPNHEASKYFLDEFEHQWIIPIGVVVETWGFIVGKNKDWVGGTNFLAWLNTPGKDLIVIGHNGEIIDERFVIESLQVDCVDSMIVTLATKIFIKCDFEKPIPVATWDTRDFFRLGGREDIKIQIYDLNEAIIQDIS
jgi:predicted nucleic acid-binding protein